MEERLCTRLCEQNLCSAHSFRRGYHQRARTERQKEQPKMRDKTNSKLENISFPLLGYSWYLSMEVLRQRMGTIEGYFMA